MAGLLPRPHGHQPGQPPLGQHGPGAPRAGAGVMGRGEVGLDSCPCQSGAAPCQSPPRGLRSPGRVSSHRAAVSHPGEVWRGTVGR